MVYRFDQLTLAGAALSSALLLGGCEAEALGPEIPPAKGEQCVEPTEVMRRSHMEFILHQRDDTVHDGIRSSKHSLEGCLDCHVQPTAEGKYPRFPDKDHFCSSCHIYAAVEIDCFQCHADHPVDADQPAAASGSPSAGLAGADGPEDQLSAHDMKRLSLN